MSLFREMCDTLTLDFEDESHAIGQSIDMGWGRVFGGQVIGQAIAMAQHQVTEQSIHSIHGHFIRTGDVQHPVHYHKSLLRKGRTYSMYRIEALQKEHLIFHAMISLQTPEKGVQHQKNAPQVPKADDLPSYNQTLRAMVGTFSEERKSNISQLWLDRLYQEPPIQVKPIQPQNFLAPDTQQAKRLLWFKSSDLLPADPFIHQKVLAWISDFPMLGTALQPSGIYPVSPQMKMTSLDHSIWFYDDFSCNEWLLMSCYSPVSGAGRGLTFAEIYRQDGTLVACCSQEGMLRTRTS